METPKTPVSPTSPVDITRALHGLGERIEKRILKSENDYGKALCFRYIRRFFEVEEVPSPQLIRAIFDFNLIPLVTRFLKPETSPKILFEVTLMLSKMTSSLLIEDDFFPVDSKNEIVQMLISEDTIEKLILLFPCDYPEVRNNIIWIMSNFASISTDLRNYLIFSGIIPQLLEHILPRRWGTKRRHIRAKAWFVSLLLFHENNRMSNVKSLLPFIRISLHDKDYVIKLYALQGLYNFTCGLKIEWLREISNFGLIPRISQLFYINLRKLESFKRREEISRKRKHVVQISEIENEIVYNSFSVLSNLMYTGGGTDTPLFIFSNGFLKRTHDYILTNNPTIISDEEKMVVILRTLSHILSLGSLYLDEMIAEDIFTPIFSLSIVCSKKVIRSQCIRFICQFVYYCDISQYQKLNNQIYQIVTSNKSINSKKKEEKDQLSSNTTIIEFLVTKVLRKFYLFENNVIRLSLDIILRVLKYEKKESIDEFTRISKHLISIGILEYLRTLESIRNRSSIHEGDDNEEEQEEEEQDDDGDDNNILQRERKETILIMLLTEG